MWFRFEIVIIGNTLSGRLLVVTAVAVAHCYFASKHLLVSERDFIHGQANLFAVAILNPGLDPVTSRRVSHGNSRACLSAGITECHTGIEAHFSRTSEVNGNIRSRSTLVVIHLHYQRLVESTSDRCGLFAAADFDEGAPVSCLFDGFHSLASCATCGQEGQQHERKE